MSPASSSTFRCWEIAGCVISNGSANSLTVASPLARRARIARRVGSANAEKAASKEYITVCLYKRRVIVKRNSEKKILLPQADVKVMQGIRTDWAFLKHPRRIGCGEAVPEVRALPRTSSFLWIYLVSPG